MAIRMQTPIDPMEEMGSKFAHLELSLVNHKIGELRLRGSYSPMATPDRLSA
jgi:hypothetical protein